MKTGIPFTCFHSVFFVFSVYVVCVYNGLFGSALLSRLLQSHYYRRHLCIVRPIFWSPVFLDKVLNFLLYYVVFRDIRFLLPSLRFNLFSFFVLHIFYYYLNSFYCTPWGLQTPFSVALCPYL